LSSDCFEPVVKSRSRGNLPRQAKLGFAGLAATAVRDAIQLKLLVPDIAGVAEAVREKEERIAGFQLERKLVVARRSEPAGGRRRGKLPGVVTNRIRRAA